MKRKKIDIKQKFKKKKKKTLNKSLGEGSKFGYLSCAKLLLKTSVKTSVDYCLQLKTLS